MKATIDDLKDSYKIGMESYGNSRIEARNVIDQYNDKQYTAEQIAVLTARGQPIESFNVIKMMTHALLGFFDTVANDIQIKPRHMDSSLSSMVMNDTVQYVLDSTRFEQVNPKLKMDMMWVGYSACYERVELIGETDEFGRKLYDIGLEHVPALQMILDPMSVLDDYSDARFQHRAVWLSEDACKRLWPRKWKALISEFNHVDDDEAEYARLNPTAEQGNFKTWEAYQIIHSIVRDGDKYWECIWSGETMLEKQQVTHSKVKWAYRITKTNTPDTVEHYGIFREVSESQKAINQALLQVQLLVNTHKALVETTSVDDIDKFKESFTRVNSVIEVIDIQGIKIENMSPDIISQYTIIDKALERIKMVLGVNDSFLGQAYASDSGRKVQLQKQASFAQLSWFVKRIQLMIELIGWDVVHLVQQYYTATRVFRITDPVYGDKWMEMNTPAEAPTGQMTQEGMPQMEPMFIESIDPKTDEVEVDEYGAIIMIPLNSADTDLQFADVDLKVESVNYNNAQEQNQLLFETFLQGSVGQALLQMNPAGYMSIAALQVQEYGSKHSQVISEVLAQTAQMVGQGQMNPALAMAGGDMQAIMGGEMGGATNNPTAGGAPKSQQLQIPTNTGGQ